MFLIRRLSPPLLLAVVTTLLFHFVEEDYRTVGLAAFESFREIAKYVLGIAIILSVATLGERLIRLVLLDGVVASALSAPVPRVLSQLSSLIVYGTAGLAIAGIVFKQDLTVLWAASGVAGIVLGMALQQMLTDVFAGLAMNFDASFKLGDSVRLTLPDHHELDGRLLEVSWRTARIMTSDGDIAIIPNAKLATAVVVNQCMPANRSRIEIPFRADVRVPPERMLRILSAAAVEAVWPDEGASPEVTARGMATSGMDYALSVLIPAVDHAAVRSRVLDRARAHLRQAGLLDGTDPDAATDRLSQHRIRAALGETFLFRDIGEEGLAGLAGRIRSEILTAGTTLCAAGETMDRAILIMEGLLSAAGRRPTDHPTLLGPGSLVGAEALLTSGAHAATVRCLTDALALIIDRDGLGGLLHDRPDLAPILSAAMAERLIWEAGGQGHADLTDLTAEIQRQLQQSFGCLRLPPLGRLAWTG